MSTESWALQNLPGENPRTSHGPALITSLPSPTSNLTAVVHQSTGGLSHTLLAQPSVSDSVGLDGAQEFAFLVSSWVM